MHVHVRAEGEREGKREEEGREGRRREGGGRKVHFTNIYMYYKILVVIESHI